MSLRRASEGRVFWIEFLDERQAKYPLYTGASGFTVGYRCTGLGMDQGVQSGIS